MGNAESQAPKSYDQHVVHEGDYLQTYHGGGPNEKINMGTNQAPVSIGAKVIQSTIALKDRHGRLQKPGEFYVEDKNGQKVFLSENGNFLPSAKILIRNAKGYGFGPSVLITGRPSHPKYTVFSSNVTSQSQSYQPISVYDLGDLRKAIKGDHYSGGKYGANYGNAAVNMFDEKRPRNAWSDLADAGRTALKVVDFVGVSALELGLDELTGGVGGTLLQVSGLDNFLQDGLDQLTNLKEQEFEHTRDQTDLSMSSWIKDPRLQDELEAVKKQSRARVTQFPKNQYSPELGKILGSPANSDMDRVVQLRKLQNLNLSVDADAQMEILKKTVTLLKSKVPNPPDFSWQTVLNGIERSRGDPQSMIRVAQLTTRNLKQKIVPILMAQQTQAVSGNSKQDSEQKTALSGDKQQPATTNLKHSDTINGNVKEPASSTTIHAHFQPPPPIPAF